MRRALLAIGIAIGAVVLAVFAFDLLMFRDDEVAILVTHETGGDSVETPLWIVEAPTPGAAPGILFVRAHSADAHWLERVASGPRVEVVRNGTNATFLAEAVPGDPELRARVNAAMAEKYGFADRLAAWLADPAESVPVRLQPAPPEGAGDR